MAGVPFGNLNNSTPSATSLHALVFSDAVDLSIGKTAGRTSELADIVLDL